MALFNYLFFIIVVTGYTVNATPVVLRESSPSGESIVAISSSDPNIERYVAKSDIPGNKGTVVQSVSVSSPGNAAAVGTGRSFASAYASSGSPFALPFLFPQNLDAFNINNWIRNVESFYEPSFAGKGDVVTAINDNGHIYGKVNGVPFDNGVKSGA